MRWLFPVVSLWASAVGIGDARAATLPIEAGTLGKLEVRLPDGRPRGLVFLISGEDS